jgi:lipoprotein-releasing system permease protein
LLWGNIAGIAIALIQQRFGIFTLDPETYYLTQVPVNLNWMHVLLLNIGTMVCCVLMLVIPSFIISRITPVKAIRFS